MSDHPKGNDDEPSRKDPLLPAKGELAEFMALALHDLRSALGSSAALAQVLRKQFGNELNEEGRWITEQIVGQQRRMGDLITGIWAFIQTMTTNREATSVALDDVLDSVLHSLQPLLQASDASVVRQGLPRVLGRQNELVELFQGLVRNSIQYRSDEAPRLVISAASDESFCTVCLNDNGIGFLPEFREEIFEPFKRLNARQSAGTGLGLAICRRIVESHTGRIWAESQPGRGSSFYFTLPLADG